MSNPLVYAVSIERASSLLTATGKSGWWMEVVAPDQAANILKDGGGPVWIAGEDFERFKTLAALHAWTFAPPDLEYADPAPAGRSRTL